MCCPCTWYRWAGITITQPTDISNERSCQLWWQDDHQSLSANVEGFFCILCSRQICLLACYAHAWYPIARFFNVTSLICANNNNGGKFYWRKSMHAAVDDNQQIGGLVKNYKFDLAACSSVIYSHYPWTLWLLILRCNVTSGFIFSVLDCLSHQCV